jgi:MinD-like ATPase involved in chromosome partitioning or flagellar assembly/DNA-binding NarL/FixJ family response regulator
VSDYRVIIIDPDPTTTNYLAFEFGKAGMIVYSTNNAKEGLVLAYQQRPHVIILEPTIAEIPAEEFLSKIRKDRRTERTRVIAFSSLTAPDEIQTAIDLGFHHYMSKDGASVDMLIDIVKDAAEAARNQAEHQFFKQKVKDIETETPAPEPEKVVIPSGSGKLIVFLSAKGGIGTSSICANLAHVYSQQTEGRVAVMDLVLPIGSLSSIVGYNGPLNIVEAAAMTSAEASFEYLRNSLPMPDPWKFQLLAGSPSPQEASELEVSNIPVILNNLRKIYDCVFVDLGKALSRISMPILSAASQIVLMLSLDQTTVTHTKSVWDYLRSEGVTKEKIYFLINRAVGLEGLKKTEVEEQIGTKIQLALPYMGRDFALANNLNQPVSLKFPQDAVSFSLVQAAEEIEERIKQLDK